MQTAIKFTANQFRLMLLQNIKPRQLSIHTWSVPSASDEHKAYLVSAHFNREGLLVTTCTCPSGQLKQACKHQLSVIHDIQRDTRILAALVPESEERAA